MISPNPRDFPLDSLSGQVLSHVEAEQVFYRGRQAVRLIEREKSASTLAVLADSEFSDGVIETEIAGNPRQDAPQDMHGFVGIAFRVQPQGARYECIYLRPTNGRADDQLRRNHSTQYISYPDYLWYRLREEWPGVYESYTDLVPGAWTPVKSLCLALGRSCTSTTPSSPVCW